MAANNVEIAFCLPSGVNHGTILRTILTCKKIPLWKFITFITFGMALK